MVKFSSDLKISCPNQWSHLIKYYAGDTGNELDRAALGRPAKTSRVMAVTRKTSQPVLFRSEEIQKTRTGLVCVFCQSLWLRYCTTTTVPPVFHKKTPAGFDSMAGAASDKAHLNTPQTPSRSVANQRFNMTTWSPKGVEIPT